MRITKFILDKNKVANNYDSFESDMKSILGDNLENFIADSENNKNYIIYFYSNNDKLKLKLVDLFIDYSVIVDMKDITESVKKDYSIFEDIDSITRGRNYDLLREFFKSVYNDDFALDYISSNGIVKFNECIVNKFFPKFYSQK